MSAPSYQTQSTLYSGVTEATAVLATPTGTQPGDLLLAILTFRRVPTLVFSDPAGWTRLFDAPAPTFARVGVFWRIAQAGEPASHTFIADQTSRRACGIMRITGADPVAPIHASAHALDAYPSLTATQNDLLVIRACGDTGSTAITFGTGYTQLWSLRGASDSAQCHAAIATAPASSGTIPALSGGTGVRMTLAIAGLGGVPPQSLAALRRRAAARRKYRL